MIGTESLKALAEDADAYFEDATRTDGTEYVRLVDGRPEWVQDLVRAAHGDMSPDDYRYRFVRDALTWIADMDEDADPYDAASNFADGNVDVYTGRLLTWLASNLTRVGYVDEAREEHGPAEDGIVSDIARGQYAESLEVFFSVLGSLRERATA